MHIANQNHIDATCNQEKKRFVQDRDDTVAAFGQPVPLGDVNRDHSTNTKNRLTKVMGSRASVFFIFSLEMKVADLSPTHFRKQSHRWYLWIYILVKPGFGGLIQGQIYNPGNL